MYSPNLPPQPPRPSSSLPLIVTLVCVLFGCLAFTGLVGYGFYLGYSSSKSEDLARRDNPRTGSEQNGWSVYDLRSIGLKIALPGPPVPDNISVTSEYKKSVKAYAAYRAQGDEYWVAIYMYDHRYEVEIDGGIQSTRDWLREWQGNNLSSTQAEMFTLQGKKAARLYSEYTEDGEKAVADTVLWVDGTRAYSITVGGWMPEPGKRKDLLDRIEKSIRIQTP